MHPRTNRLTLEHRGRHAWSMMRVLLIGKNGQVGHELADVLARRHDVVAVGRAEMDLTDNDSVRSGILAAAPNVIVNAAGSTVVDRAESEPELTMQVNATAPGVMAETAKSIGALLVHFSTDYVFDGTKTFPYCEEDTPRPINIYGKTKLAGEQAILAAGCAYLILRASWIYSGRRSNFVLTMLRLARERAVVDVVDDQIGSPTWARALAISTAELICRRENHACDGGLFHLSANGFTSRFDFAKKIIEIAGGLLPDGIAWAEIRRTTSRMFPLPAERPLNVATSKKKIAGTYGLEMPDWKVQLAAFLSAHCRPSP